MLRSREAEEFFNPGILPRRLGRRQPASQSGGKLLRFPHQVRAVRIENVQPGLEVIHTCGSTSFAVVQRPKVADLQFHTEKQRLHFFVGSSDVAQTAGSCYAIEYLGIWYEPDAIVR